MQKSLKYGYSRGATWLLVIYLSVMVSGCATRPDALPPEEARILQTREFNGSPDEVAKAVSIVLQEMHYTLDNVDMGLGIITATRSSEYSLAPISKELQSGNTEFSDELGTFCLVAGGIVLAVLLFSWIFDKTDDDDDEDEEERHERRDRSYHSHSHSGSSWSLFGGSDDSGPDSYTYTMTINMEALTLQQTKVYVTVQGKHREGNEVVKSGPVQDQQFYIDFFTRLQTTFNN